MLDQFKQLGKAINKTQQKHINGGKLPDSYCQDFDSYVTFNPECDLDRDGRECRFPFYVNSFGRCTL